MNDRISNLIDLQSIFHDRGCGKRIGIYEMTTEHPLE